MWSYVGAPKCRAIAVREIFSMIINIIIVILFRYNRDWEPRPDYQ